MGFKLGCYTDICIWHLMIDAAEICTRFSTIVTCWLQLISPVRDDETARVLARDECHGWLPLYNLRPRPPPPSSITQGTEDRSSTCRGLVGMSANWGQSSEFVDTPARFTLCPNLNLECGAVGCSHIEFFSLPSFRNYAFELVFLWSAYVEKLDTFHCSGFF